jgi:hypothetical protein
MMEMMCESGVQMAGVVDGGSGWPRGMRGEQV